MALSFPLPARLGSFYFLFFAYSAAYVAYFPLYLAPRAGRPCALRAHSALGIRRVHRRAARRRRVGRRRTARQPAANPRARRARRACFGVYAAERRTARRDAFAYRARHGGARAPGG